MQSETKKVQVIFPGEIPDRFEIPGAIRSSAEGSVVNAVVKIVSETQLDSVRAISGARVSEFPLGLEDIFIEIIGPDADDSREEQS